MFPRAFPPVSCCQSVCKAQFDINDSLVGYAPEARMVVKDLHVLLILCLGNQPLLPPAHAVVLYLRHKYDWTAV